MMKYNRDLVAKIVKSDKFTLLAETMFSFDTFKTFVEEANEFDLDDIYYTIKAIINDFTCFLHLFIRLDTFFHYNCFFAQKISVSDNFEAICDVICKILDCDRATLYLLDSSKDELWSRAAKGTNNTIRLPIGVGIAGSVAETNKPIVLEDAYQDSRFNKKIDQKTGYRTKSMLVWPIRDKETEKLFGVFQAINKKSKFGIFDQNDKIISELLSALLATQIKSSFEYSDFSNHEFKLMKLLKVTI